MRARSIGLIGLLSPLLCAGQWSWGAYHLAQMGCTAPVQRPSKRTTKLCCARHVMQCLVGRQVITWNNVYKSLRRHMMPSNLTKLNICIYAIDAIYGSITFSKGIFSGNTRKLPSLTILINAPCGRSPFSMHISTVWAAWETLEETGFISSSGKLYT